VVAKAAIWSNSVESFMADDQCIQGVAKSSRCIRWFTPPKSVVAISGRISSNHMRDTELKRL
jgi:hypothetical protein